SLVLIEGTRAILDEIPRAGSGAVKATIGTLIALVSMTGYYRELLLGDNVGTVPRFFFEEAPKVRAFYGKTPPHLFELDDGIITFITGFPAMSGARLAFV